LGGCGIAKVINAVHALAATAVALKDLQSEIQRGEKVSYEATYQTLGGSGPSAPVTFAQEPGGKYAFVENGAGGSAATEFVADGKNQYDCSQVTGSKWSCLQSAEPARAASLDGDPFFAFTGAYVYGLIEALQVEAALVGFKVTHSSPTVNGIPLKCVAVSGKENGQTEDYKWCITSDGVLGLVNATGSSEGGGSSFEITKLTTSPSSSMFEPPAGATLTTTTVPTTTT
jgi:hypothetical protein